MLGNDQRPGTHIRCWLSGGMSFRGDSTVFTDLHAEGSSLADSGSSYRSVPLIEHTLSVKIVQKWVPDGGSHYQGDSFDCRGKQGENICVNTLICWK